MGVNAIASLLTRNARLKQEWEETVNAENTWTYPISSVEEMRDFYREPSRAGALDPMDMCFDGIGCLRMEGNDTVFSFLATSTVPSYTALSTILNLNWYLTH